ncbi:MAG: hypothetical protein IK088_06095 [Lachnospiraceae bacterium]|nr:hypothetical protein [Lachnospiraceae bacterium]
MPIFTGSDFSGGASVGAFKLQELQRDIENMERKIRDLESTVRRLEAEIERLKSRNTK